MEIEMPSVKGGQQSELCFLLLALHVEKDLRQLSKPKHILSLAEEIVWGDGSQKGIKGVPGNWGEIAELLTLSLYCFNVRSCRERKGTAVKRKSYLGT